MLFRSIFLFEPHLINYPDTSMRHLQFQYHGIQKMNGKLSKDMTNKELLNTADAKVNEMLTVNSDYWYREQLVEEMKKRGISYDYDKIMRGKYVLFSDVK